MKKNMRRGMARVQFLAVEPEVKDFLAKGYTMRMTYEFMIEKGKISMAYSSFTGFLNQKSKIRNLKEKFSTKINEETSEQKHSQTSKKDASAVPTVKQESESANNGNISDIIINQNWA